MATVSISETKAKLSALIDRVLAGERVTITDRGVPVARLVPLGESTSTGTWDDRLEGLERAGAIVRPTRPLDLEAFLARPRIETRTSVVDALLDERRTSDR
jgi:prevent-host-death family protein